MHKLGIFKVNYQCFRTKNTQSLEIYSPPSFPTFIETISFTLMREYIWAKTFSQCSTENRFLYVSQLK